MLLLVFVFSFSATLDDLKEKEKECWVANCTAVAWLGMHSSPRKCTCFRAFPNNRSALFSGTRFEHQLHVTKFPSLVGRTSRLRYIQKILRAVSSFVIKLVYIYWNAIKFSWVILVHQIQRSQKQYFYTHQLSIFEKYFYCLPSTTDVIFNFDEMEVLC